MAYLIAGLRSLVHVIEFVINMNLGKLKCMRTSDKQRKTIITIKRGKKKYTKLNVQTFGKYASKTLVTETTD